MLPPAQPHQQQGLPAASVADCGHLRFGTLGPSRHRARFGDYEPECAAAAACRRQGVAMPIGVGVRAWQAPVLRGPCSNRALSADVVATSAPGGEFVSLESGRRAVASDPASGATPAVRRQGRRAMTAHADRSLFAGPRIAMQEREDGCLLLRSADLLQDYPSTVVHSLQAWAAADPDYPLVAPARRPRIVARLQLRGRRRCGRGHRPDPPGTGPVPRPAAACAVPATVSTTCW